MPSRAAGRNRSARRRRRGRTRIAPKPTRCWRRRPASTRWLAADKVEPPGAALLERVLDSAPVRQPAPPRRRLWWSGAAVAGVGLLGGVAGAFAVSFFVLTETAAQAPLAHESSYLTSSFGGASADWSDEMKRPIVESRAGGLAAC